MAEQNQVTEESLLSGYVAVIPAAGAGTRLPDRELSKELLPFGPRKDGSRPVISHLLRCLGQAAIDDLIIIVRDDKKDIMDYVAGPEWSDRRIRVITTPGTSGVPETVALGLRDAGAHNIAFGFPDILFEPQDAFADLKSRLTSSRADIVLGLFPTDKPAKFDMVATDGDGQVTSIEIKPDTTTLALTWIIAAWTPAFSEFLTRLVFEQPARLDALAGGSGGSHLGHAFQLAMSEGFTIDSVRFDDGRILDIGTPDDLARAADWEPRSHG